MTRRFTLLALGLGLLPFVALGQAPAKPSPENHLNSRRQGEARCAPKFDSSSAGKGRHHGPGKDSPTNNRPQPQRHAANSPQDNHPTQAKDTAGKAARRVDGGEV